MCVVDFFQDISSKTYFAITLALNIILTSLIVLRLWQCKVQSRKVLGDGHGKHYNVLSIVFMESAFMNAVCSILLLASSLSGRASQSPTMVLMFAVWAAITPAVQVGNSIFHHDAISDDILFHPLGMFKLFDHISRYERVVWKLE